MVLGERWWGLCVFESKGWGFFGVGGVEEVRSDLGIFRYM